jgi:hypothetical protein
METIMFKVPDGTKAQLKRIRSNLSALFREYIDQLLQKKSDGKSAYDKASGLCGSIKGGPRNMATSKEYLKQYAPKRAA